MISHGKPNSNKTGRGFAWIRAKKRWFKENEPNFQGYYECYLCHKWVPKEEITIDHVIPRSRRPDLVTDQSNLRACCWTCNGEKGSKVYSV